jgi:hypothetical protein
MGGAWLAAGVGNQLPSRFEDSDKPPRYLNITLRIWNGLSRLGNVFPSWGKPTAERRVQTGAIRGNVAVRQWGCCWNLATPHVVFSG